MGRIRTVKPEFFKHEGLFDAETEYKLPLRLAFEGLWTQADREGRFKWLPRSLKSDILPYDDVDFSRVLDALMTRGFIVKYEVDGELYGYIPSWSTHQIINNRESASKLPPPPNEPNKIQCASTRASPVNDACPTPLCNTPAEGEGEREQGTRKGNGTDLRERARTMHQNMALGTILHFAKFKAAYPKPSQWELAEQEWRKKNLDAIAEEIILPDLAKRKAEHAYWVKIRFIPNPENYLEKEMWKHAIIPNDETDERRVEWAGVGTLTGAGA